MLFILSIPVVLSMYLALHVLIGQYSTKWPHTRGKLVSLNIDTRKQYSKFPSITGISYFCIVTIKYEYIVKDQKYISNRVNFGKAISYQNREEVDTDEFIEAVRNNDFDVYYLEAFPRIAVLKPGMSNAKEHIYSIVFILTTGLALFAFYHVVSKLMH